MRTLQRPKRVRNGPAGVMILVLIAVGQGFTNVPMLFAQPDYYGQFNDSAGLNAGDKVRIAGLDVGTVKSMEIEGNHVLMGFTLGASRSVPRAGWPSAPRPSWAGEPRGRAAREQDSARPTAYCRVGQTTTPYQFYDAVFDVTKAAQGWDIDTVKRSLNVLSETIDQTYPHLSAALDGVARFSDTIGKRDEQFKKLLASANQVASVLGNRSEQINRLAGECQDIAGCGQRPRPGHRLPAAECFAGLQSVRGLINDNPNLNHVLEQLRTISDILVKHKVDLADVWSRPPSSWALWLRPSPPARTSRCWWSTWCRTRSCSRGSMPRSRSAASTLRSSGVTRVCRPSSSRIPMARAAQRCAAAGAAVVRGHPGTSGSGRGARFAVLIHAAGRRHPGSGQSDAVRRSSLRVRSAGPAYSGARHRDLAAEPGRRHNPGVPSAAFPGELSPDVQGVPGAPLAPGPPGPAPCRSGPTPGPADRHSGVRPATAGPGRTDPATGTRSAGAAGRRALRARRSCRRGN